MRVAGTHFPSQSLRSVERRTPSEPLGDRTWKLRSKCFKAAPHPLSCKVGEPRGAAGPQQHCKLGGSGGGGRPPHSIWHALILISIYRQDAGVCWLRGANPDAWSRRMECGSARRSLTPRGGRRRRPPVAQALARCAPQARARARGCDTACAASFSGTAVEALRNYRRDRGGPCRDRCSGPAKYCRDR